MKIQFLRIFSIILIFFMGSVEVQAADFYKEKMNDIGGDAFSLEKYSGKTILLTNIATKCGYTPQLKGLEAVYKKYKSKGLIVIGIPSNDFGGQTPEKNKDVKKFCLLNYGVSFPLTEKTIVKGSKKHPMIADLISKTNNKSEISWNFEKFLISKSGKVIARFSSKVKPEDKDFLNKIEANL